MNRLKKICKDVACRRAGLALSLEEFPRNHCRPDGRNLYCRECAVRKVREYRERKRTKKKSEKVFHAAITARRRPKIAANIRSAIASGMTTREQIQQSTKLDYDTLGEILTELVWESKTVRIERRGRERQFVIAA